MEAVANYKKPLAALGAAVMLLFSGYCLFYKLGNESFQDYDEATYAQVTHESMAQGNPSSLMFLNTPYFRKPPLLFWMTTASQQVFSDVEFADRFPSALAGLLTIILVALICIEIGAGIPVALSAATILATAASWMEFARDVRFDNLVALFCAAALYAAIRAARDARWFLLVGVALALAILAKSVMALFGGIPVLAFLIYERKLPTAFRDRYFWLGIGIFLLIVVPWHLYMTITYGMSFWYSYLGDEVITRASTNLFAGGSNPTNIEYVEYLLQYAAPWTTLFVLSFICSPFLLRRLSGRARSVFAACLVTVLSVLVVAFVAHTKAYGYLMPLYPFMAVALALGGREIWMRASHIRIRGRVINLQPLIIGMFGIFFVYAGLFTRYEALHLDPLYGYEIGESYEERDVASQIRTASNPVVYTYGNYADFGTILYYSRLPDTPNPLILLWSDSSTPSASSTNFILANASTTVSALSSAFPQYRFTQNYSGKFVELFTVTPSRSAAR